MNTPDKNHLELASIFSPCQNQEAEKKEEQAKQDKKVGMAKIFATTEHPVNNTDYESEEKSNRSASKLIMFRLFI